jgi:hypothetical protein
MSAAAVVVIINRPPNSQPEDNPVIEHRVIGDVSGLNLQKILQSVADELAEG